MPDRSELGKRIKKVREAKHLTLKNIEAVAGISATHVSEIERGKTSPTLGALLRIADALGKDAAYFVEEEDLTDISIVALENRIQESLQPNAAMLERLTASIPGGRLQSCVITFEPGKNYSWEPRTHLGNEAVLILSGKVSFTFDEDKHELGSGDSIFYEASHVRRYTNTSQTDAAQLIWISTSRDVT